MRLLPILLAALAGCATAPPPGAQHGSIAGSVWEITAIGEMAVPEQAPDGRYRIAFADGRVSGRAGCNSFSGPYSRIGDRLEFGVLAATRMACLDPQMEHERRAFAILRGSVEVRSAGDDAIVLSSPDGSLRLRRSAADRLP